MKPHIYKTGFNHRFILLMFCTFIDKERESSYWAGLQVHFVYV